MSWDLFMDITAPLLFSYHISQNCMFQRRDRVYYTIAERSGDSTPSRSQCQGFWRNASTPWVDGLKLYRKEMDYSKLTFK
jgi:hypothetical protein